MTITHDLIINSCYVCPYHLSLKPVEKPDCVILKFMCLHPGWTEADNVAKLNVNPDECKLEKDDVIIKYKKVKQ